MAVKSYNTPDFWLRMAGILGLVISAAVGIIEYIGTTRQQAALETNKFAADQGKLLFEQQTSLYFRASQLAATIAIVSGGPERAKAVEEFEELYYGPMVIVEDRNDAPPAKGNQKADGQEPKYAKDRNVEARMIAFEKCLEQDCDRETLKQRSLELSDACRTSLLLGAQDRVNGLQLQLDKLDVTKRLSKPEDR
jgi:hypothetical protein